MTEKVVIIGAGPSGIACATQLKRGGFDPLVLYSAKPGGLVREANLVENYPGFPGGISGEELANLMHKHLERTDVRTRYAAVSKVTYAGDQFSITTMRDETISADICVVASGTLPNQPDDIEIDHSASVSYSVLKLALAEGRKICIIGGGEAALDYGMRLSDNNRVVVLVRGERPKGIRSLREMAQKRLDIRPRSRVIQIDRNTSVHLDNGDVLSFDHVLVAIGRSPATWFLYDLRHQIDELAEQERLLFAGDIGSDKQRQVAIAAGDGVRTAMRILEKYGDNI